MRTAMALRVGIGGVHVSSSPEDKPLVGAGQVC